MEIFSRYEPNVEVWIPNIDRGWILAKILEKSVENNSLSLSLYTELDQYVSYTYQITPNVDPNSILPPLQNPSFMLELNALENLANLTYLHKLAVFNGIELRFENEIIYTYSGIVLIAVNPFKKLDLFSVEIMRGELEPHLYAITEDANRNMLRNGKNQLIIVSGESGAGKTVAAKFVMKYFSTIADLDLKEAGYAVSKPKPNDAFLGVDEAVLSTNPIMESFGYAKTA
ncbi:Myosin type-2 heavy chain 1 [Nowakowskiella sp. JEL0407]|nr:Myosin type-2 heavy chain 1 [Nowakowskiella sp. JEL0407]